MDANNMLFWTSGLLGVGALIAIVVSKLKGQAPAPAEHPAADLPKDSE